MQDSTPYLRMTRCQMCARIWLVKCRLYAFYMFAPNIPTNISPSLGTEDVTWDAAATSCGSGEPACFELWRSVRDVLTNFEPTVSFKALIRLYNMFASDSVIAVLEAIKAQVVSNEVFTSAQSHDNVFLSVFIWVSSILQVSHPHSLCTAYRNIIHPDSEC